MRAPTNFADRIFLFVVVFVFVFVFVFLFRMTCRKRNVSWHQSSISHPPSIHPSKQHDIVADDWRCLGSEDLALYTVGSVFFFLSQLVFRSVFFVCFSTSNLILCSDTFWNVRFYLCRNGCRAIDPVSVCTSLYPARLSNFLSRDVLLFVRTSFAHVPNVTYVLFSATDTTGTCTVEPCQRCAC